MWCNLEKINFLSRTWCSTWQWSDLPMPPNALMSRESSLTPHSRTRQCPSSRMLLHLAATSQAYGLKCLKGPTIPDSQLFGIALHWILPMPSVESTRSKSAPRLRSHCMRPNLGRHLLRNQSSLFGDEYLPTLYGVPSRNLLPIWNYPLTTLLRLPHVITCSQISTTEANEPQHVVTCHTPHSTLRFAAASTSHRAGRALI